MAHKANINGTNYELGGGVTLVDGTSYSIDKGKVLIDGTAYDISFILPPGLIDVYSGYNASPSLLAYVNGYYIVGGYYLAVQNTYTYRGRIAYTKDPMGEWAITDIENLTVPQGIAYANGYWVICGRDTYSNAFIAYATDLAGTWKRKSFYNTGIFDFHCITYANGYWVIGGDRWADEWSRYDPFIYYTTDPTGTWTRTDFSGSSNSYNSIRCITYANGYWVVGGEYTWSNYQGVIYYSKNLSSGWTKKVLWEKDTNLESSRYANYVHSVKYINGYWVAVGQRDELYGSVGYTTDLTGNWTTKDIYLSRSVYDIDYANGYWVACGENGISYAANLSDAWTAIPITSSSNIRNLMNVVNTGEYWMTAGYYKDGDTYARIAHFATPDGFAEVI